ncbi:hypothetical protein STEG23_015953, partial [Scotinomys teguina]
MASLQQGEKQLFEKFWKGTFKAVATPRPESIIVASITARKPLPSRLTKRQNSLATSGPLLPLKSLLWHMLSTDSPGDPDEMSICTQTAKKS